jgi:hypothetical protein
MNRWLVLIGIGFVLVGLAWPWVSKIPWGRLPGDLSIEREHFSFHFPLMTGLVISAVLSLLLWWFRK